MRKAAAGWEEEYAKKFEEEGYKRGIGAPTVFYNEKAETRLVVHGDDFTFSGPRKELMRMRKKMKEWYEIKDRGIMGSGGDEIKEVTILRRILRWTEEGLEYEADGKHVRDLMEAEGLNENSKAVVSPVVKPKSKLEDEESEELGREELKEYRGEAAKLNYLGGDRPDLQYATKEICQGMARPTVEGNGEDKEGGPIPGRFQEVGVGVPRVRRRGASSAV